MTRMLIAGSRDFQDYRLLCAYLDEITAGIQGEIEVISGQASGADTLGERYAREHGLKVRRFPARWDQLGRSAGVARNRQMIDYIRQESPIAVFFWDGSSRGTLDTIRRAEKAGIDTRIINYQEENRT